MLNPEEVTILESGGVSTSYAEFPGSGLLQLTTQRLVWIFDSHRKAVACSLGSIANSKAVSGGLFGLGSQKLEVTTKDQKLCLFTFKANLDSMLKRLAEQRNIYAEQLVQQQQQKAIQAQQQPSFSTSSAGIAGVLRAVQTQAKEREDSLSQAFTDLAALMENAKTMVAIAQKITARAESAASASASSSSSPSLLSSSSSSSSSLTSLPSSTTTSVTNEYLLSVGLQSPVTKTSAGTAFHQQLSRQICEFLQQPLEEHGGVLPLPDVYCLYNRARGSDLISPDDLVRACNLFSKLGLPLKMKKLPSGVIIIVSKLHSDEAVSERLRAFAEEAPLTSFEVARRTKTTITLASEQLLIAERAGVLCRDQSVEGLVFYPNLFPKFCASV